MNDNILSVSDLTKNYGSLNVIKGLSLNVRRHERHALIGPNGAGKSTLIGLLSGSIPPTGGDIRLNGRSIVGLKPHKLNRLGLGRSFQITNIFRDMSVLDNVKLGIMARCRMTFGLLRPSSRLKEIEAEAMDLVKAVNLEKLSREPADALSYSAQRSLEIAITLATDPEFVLLDEPMAGMSQDESAATTELLRRVTAGRTLLMVEHDMSVVFSLCDRISVLVYGGILASGTPEEIRSNREVQNAYLGEVVS